MPIPTSAFASAGAAAAALLLRHEHDVRDAAERLAAAALETLLNAIDANDAQTGAHVRRVAAYALTLGDAADLKEDELRVVEQVALFHDVGKIHEALFDIIHDDRRLTPSERAAIATHPQRGATVLEPLSSFYPELPEGVLSHHERWDGDGYPRGLKGRHIPISARVVAIVDTFDAITYHRRYSAGRSSRSALDIILDARGTQFDPELVDLFACPPVFERILETERRVKAWDTPVRPRSSGREEDEVPQITFRWRPERRGATGQRRRDR